MSNKQFINDLSATYADVRRLDAKKVSIKTLAASSINLAGKNILEYLSGATIAVKHTNDTRETITENDLWGQWVESKDGETIIHDGFIEKTWSNSTSWNKNITKVENNKAYINDAFFANIQTDMLENGDALFGTSNLSSFNVSALPNLKSANNMFYATKLASYSTSIPELKSGIRMFFNCSSLQTIRCEFPSLENGNNMFEGCSALSTFVTESLPRLKDATYMFYATKLASFTTAMPELETAEYMFYGGSSLISFTGSMPSLKNARNMFCDCYNLTSFSCPVPALKNGQRMFGNCLVLETINSDFTSLEDGFEMFAYCTSLAEFDNALPMLMSGKQMFIGCSDLKSFTSDLNNLTDGSHMFKGCSSLTNFVGSLLSLEDGTNMFSECKLSPLSVIYILDSLPNRESLSNITIGINVQRAGDVSFEERGRQLEAFAKDMDFDNWEEVEQAFRDKNWEVAWEHNGIDPYAPAMISEDPAQIFVKLVEVAESERAEYCSEDGTKFYNLVWGHATTHPENYNMFSSLEEAVEFYHLIPRETPSEAQ